MLQCNMGGQLGVETLQFRIHSFTCEAFAWEKDREKKEIIRLKKMASDRQNLQDAFLNHVRKTKVPVTVFLINGVKLQGVITWFDNFCVLLRRDGQSQLVYKHAISTIMPAQPINLYEGEDAS